MLTIMAIVPLQAIAIIQYSKRIENILYIGISFSIFGMIQSQIIIETFNIDTNLFQYQAYGKQGLDGISIWQVWQVNMLMPIVQFSTWRSIKIQPKNMIILQFMISFWTFQVFTTTDMQLFYISFEGVQIPMFLLIGFYGGRNRKIHAAYQFFIYTLFGSQFLLLAFIILYIESGSSYFQQQQSNNINPQIEVVIWQGFFIALAIKVPMVPAHIWLPEAHVEAPTAASVIQAAILQKQGSYGMLRYSLTLFGESSKVYAPIIATQCLIAIIYSSLACLALWDMKKLIAYSSIGHMNTATLAIFTNDYTGITISIYFLISHGLISSGQFLQIGVLYDRYHTRTIKYFRGVALIMPIFSTFFFIFILANIAVPGTSGFISEFFTFLSIFQMNPFIGFISSLAIIQAPAYSQWFLHKIIYGSLTTHIGIIIADMNYREFSVLAPLTVFTLYIGQYPDFILSYITGIQNLLFKL